MNKVTVHNFTKFEKPISVNGVPYGVARFENQLWHVYGRRCGYVGSCKLVREIEFVVMKGE